MPQPTYNPTAPLDSNEQFIKAMLSLNTERVYTLKDLAIKSSRVLNHWDKQGLLLTTRDSHEEWRKFSFIDVVWINIITELREFGYPIPKIKKIKAKLLSKTTLADSLKKQQGAIDILKSKKPEAFEEYLKHQEMNREQAAEAVTILDADMEAPEFNFPTNELTIYLTDFLWHRMTISLWVFPDGNYTVWKDTSIDLMTEEIYTSLKQRSFVSISLSKIVKLFVHDQDPVSVLPRLHFLNDDEIYILKTINEGEYESITVKLKDGEPNLIELTKQEDTKRRLVDILTDGDYQEISIKKHKGRITTIKNTIQIKL